MIRDKAKYPGKSGYRAQVFLDRAAKCGIEPPLIYDANKFGFGPVVVYMDEKKAGVPFIEIEFGGHNKRQIRLTTGIAGATNASTWHFQFVKFKDAINELLRQNRTTSSHQ